ncbi:hypothetical protein [Pseudomonas sp.]|uniref:hypothetical protein n=1 Tax=Pseudomonas sp. TaxID=306 RepID=UPI003F3FA435
MTTMNNCVAVDWRAGHDRIYFFFKNSDTYSRFDIADNKVAPGYPTATHGRWGTFDHFEDLRFGFTTTSLGWNPSTDSDVLWLFYYDGGTPMVCKYDQDDDSVAGTDTVANSLWAPLLPYFSKIVAGTWREVSGFPFLFTFLLNDGRYLSFDYKKNQLTAYLLPSGMEHYKDRFITAAQYDRTFVDSYWYIFLTNNEYLVYNIQLNKLIQGPRKVDNTTWPGLLHD